jgi:hypothetical protein
MYRYKRKIIFAICLTILFSGCGGGEKDKSVNSTNLENSIKNIGTLSKLITVPNMPERSQVDATIEGVDKNRNLIRDDLENISYQGLKSMENIDESQYEQVLKIIKMLQPKNPPVEKSINEHDIYCQYLLLSDNVQEELSLDFLYGIVLNTPQRKEAFRKSLQLSTINSGVEKCE